MAHRDVVVMGASAGGVEALSEVLRGLPADLPAAVFVAMHTSAESPGLLAQILGRRSALLVTEASDGAPIVPRQVYVACPDRHLLVETDRVRVVHGPRQNRHRPAIDPLFRSAAVAFGPRVVGVVLTGSLDDGTAGLLAIKARGGLAVVQDPYDATFPGMPQSALRHVEVDHVAPAAAIADVLIRAITERVALPDQAARPDLEVELRSDSGDGHMEDMEAIGTPSVFACPECSGTLWEVGTDDLPRFRCRVGHAYSAESLAAEQDEAQDDALWAALRALEENASLARRLAARFRHLQQGRISDRYEHKAKVNDRHAGEIRRLLRQKTPEEAPQAI